MNDQTGKPEEIRPEQKPCFIITPIGEINSEPYVKAMGLIKSVIDPVLKRNGYFAQPANEISLAGSINKQVIERIVQDELVIANLTGLNPNVMYELAIRHSYRKKVVIMAEKGTKLPFDISDQRTIFYDDSLHGSEEAKPKLDTAIKEVLKNDVTSNPIIDAIKEAAVLNSILAEDNGGALKYIVEKLDRIETNLDQNRSPKSSYSRIKNYQEVFKVTLGKTPKLIDDSPDAIQKTLVSFAQGLPGLSFMTLEADADTVKFMMNVKDLGSFMKFRELLLNSDQFILAKERQL